LGLPISLIVVPSISTPLDAGPLSRPHRRFH
jgi:hypothetical protein